MHAKLDVIVKLAQFRHRVRVAHRRLRVHFRCRATGDRLDHAQHGAADVDVPAYPVALAPGRSAAEPHIGAEPPTMATRANFRLEVAQAGQVDEADHLAPLVAEAVTWDVVKARGAARLLAQIIRQETTDALAPRLGQRVLD